MDQNNQKPDKQKHLKIKCYHHSEYNITHGCSLLGCVKNMLFCSGCFLEQLEHTVEHQQYIVPLNNFFEIFVNHIYQVQDILRPVKNITNNDQNKKDYELFIENQKEIIEVELKQILRKIEEKLQEIQIQAFKELDHFQIHIKNQYDEFESFFQQKQFSYLSISDENDFKQKIQQFNSKEVQEFLENLKQSFNFLRNPQNSSMVKRLQKMSELIQHNIKNKVTQNLQLQETTQSLNEYLDVNLREKIQNYLQNLRERIEFSANFQEKSEFSPYSQKIQQNYTYYSPQKSQRITRDNMDYSDKLILNQQKSPFHQQNFQQNSDLTNLKLINQTKNNNCINLQNSINSNSSVKANYQLSQKQAIISNHKSLSSNALKLKFNMESTFELDEKTSSICCLCIKENLVLVGS